MGKTRNWHAVNAQFRTSAGPMKDKRERDHFNARQVLAETEHDEVHPEEILDEEAERELRAILEGELDVSSGEDQP